jgi:hypothetical protein
MLSAPMARLNVPQKLLKMSLVDTDVAPQRIALFSLGKSPLNSFEAKCTSHNTSMHIRYLKWMITLLRCMP